MPKALIRRLSDGNAQTNNATVALHAAEESSDFVLTHLTFSVFGYNVSLTLCCRRCPRAVDFRLQSLLFNTLPESALLPARFTLDSDLVSTFEVQSPLV